MFSKSVDFPMNQNTLLNLCGQSGCVFGGAKICHEVSCQNCRMLKRQVYVG